MENNNLLKFQELLDTHERIVFFGGAGVSTASGIPDFRSKDGLYNQHDVQFDQYSPEYLLSHDCLERDPEVFYEFYRQKLNIDGIEPNITHYRLAELEKTGRLIAVITQNIDGLHQKAGSEKVYEIHGTTQRTYCDRCGKEFHSKYIFECKERIPRCDCGGKIRPDVTLYGESLPDEAWSQSVASIRNADMLIIAGTSLVVYPAANLVDYFAGDALVLLNMQSTPRDQWADLTLRDPMQDIFAQIQVR